MFKHLIQPVRIGTLDLRNRMVQAAMGTNLAARDGTVTDASVAYYARRAQGGIGLLITEVCAPEPAGRVIPGELDISSHAFIPGLARLATAAHAGGAKIALQLAHGGCFASKAVTGVAPVSPSGVGTALLPDDQPRPLTIAEIQHLVQLFGQAAQRARIAGFDAVEIHGAHGYLPLQFLSGYTNRRTDEYGGSLENRARFALDIIRAIKEHAGQDFPIIYRLSAEEDVPGGLTLAEAIRFAQLAVAAGADALHISAGTWDSRIAAFGAVMTGQEPAAGKRLGEGVSIGVWVPPHYVPRGNLLPLAAAIKPQVTVPVIAVAGITPGMGEEAIATGKADLIALGRQMLADPDMPRKLLAGKANEIRRCVRCNDCLGSVLSYRGIACAVNAEAGREHETFTGVTPAPQPRRVLVVGGGPAGMEAARIAALRRHRVTLYERAAMPGGMLYYAAIPQFNQDYRAFLAWQHAELDRLGVQVILGTEVTPELVREEQPDVVIVATGARPVRPAIEGSNDPGIFGMLDVLGGKIPTGKRIIVCGAGLVGAEVGLFLAEQHQKQVILVDQLPTLAPQVEIFTRWVLQGRMAELGVEVRLNHTLRQLSATGVACLVEGAEVSIEGDAVVLALGLEPDQRLYSQLRELPIEVIPIGDAVAARKVFDAIHEGYHAGRRI